MPDDRTETHFIEDLTRIFYELNPPLHVHTRRAFVNKAVDDFSRRLKKDPHRSALHSPVRYYFSKNVIKKAADAAGWNKKECRCDHLIPTGLLSDHLAPLDPSRTPKPEERKQFIHNMFLDWIAICWITIDEDKILSLTPAAPDELPKGKSVVRKLKDNMPRDYSEAFDKRWARYNAVNEYWKTRKPSEEDLRNVFKMDRERFEAALPIEPGDHKEVERFVSVYIAKKKKAK